MLCLSTPGSNGVLSEARWLLDLGLLPNTNPATRAIGYRQVNSFFLYWVVHNELRREGFLVLIFATILDQQWKYDSLFSGHGISIGMSSIRG